MSSGVACTCQPKSRAGWYVQAYRCNYSAFNGYHRMPSDYSHVRCVNCHGTWRTKALYVESLPHIAPEPRP
jgi:hypothetical protein